MKANNLKKILLWNRKSLRIASTFDALNKQRNIHSLLKKSFCSQLTINPQPKQALSGHFFFFAAKIAF